MYSPLIIAYLFFGGSAGGMLLVMSLWSLFFYRTSRARRDRLLCAFSSLQKRTYPIGCVLLIVAFLCLLGDINYLDRAFLVFLHPHATPITFGAYFLAVEFILALLLAIANTLEPLIFSGKIRGILEGFLAVSSIAVMVYTGIYLYSIIDVPLWNTPLLIILFFLSSLSSGISATLLVDYFADGSTLLLRAAKPLQKSHLITIGLESLTSVAYGAYLLATPRAVGSLALLTAPDTAPILFIGFIGFGLVAPFTMEAYTLMRKECRTIPVSDFVCLLGGFCLRWCVIMCATH